MAAFDIINNKTTIDKEITELDRFWSPRYSLAIIGQITPEQLKKYAEA